jgi:hypothetical protein
MILYSVVPVEMVFGGGDGQGDVKFLEAGYKGEKVIVAQTQDNRYIIARLLSTSPHTFLRPEFQPGSMVNASELIFPAQHNE